MGSGKGAGRRESPAQIRKCVAQHETQRLLACGRLEVLLTSMSISRGEVVFAIDQAEGSARRRGLIAAVEMIRESLFQVRRIADIQLAVGFAEENVDAVTEFGEGGHGLTLPDAGEGNNSGSRAVARFRCELERASG